jgi:MFS family permease
MIPLAPNYFWLSVFYILRIGVANISSPLVGSLFMKLVKEEERATANSIVTVVGMATDAICPALSGRLMETASLDLAPFIGIAVFAAYPALFYLLFRGAVEQEPKQP